MKIYCTLFDSNYLSRGLACYESLKKNSSSFLLYVFAFDDLAHRILKDLHLENVRVISLQEFEDPELLAIKPTRTQQEYCWTCTPSVIAYVLKHFSHDNCTYIDADLFFYKNPECIIDEMEDNSVLITPHFYTPRYDQSATSGIYCVQFVTFKNNIIGNQVLNWWRSACLDWCYSRFEDGKFGDQKYLDIWPEIFDGVYVTQNRGEGVAPWNIQSWDEAKKDDIIFYHFHALKNYSHFSFKGLYDFPAWSNQGIYRNYVKELRKIERSLSASYSDFTVKKNKLTLRMGVRYLLELFKFKKKFVFLPNID